jgi:hypothetical protein
MDLPLTLPLRYHPLSRFAFSPMPHKTSSQSIQPQPLTGMRLNSRDSVNLVSNARHAL